MAEQTLDFQQNTMDTACDDCVVVAAIDFGTTYSGYAFCFVGDSDALIVNKNWGSSGGLTSLKTPTSVLTQLQTDGSHTFLNFGFEAEENYVTRLAGDSKDATCLYNRFKMKLHRQIPLREEDQEDDAGPLETMVDKRGVNKAESIQIFTMALTYIKEHLVERINEATQTAITAKYIRWVLTVPAIWSVRAKSFMRNAAYKAGLIDAEDSSRLLFALEPEAASMYCKSLRLNHFIGEKRKEDLHMPAHTIYVIVDAGGGTVDMTVHETMPDGSVEEVCVATGGPWGGTSIDKAFLSLLKKLWGAEYIKKLQTKYPAVWWDIENHFERVKRMARPDGEEEFSLFSITMKMAQLYQEMTGEDIADISKPGISVNEDYQLVATKDTLDGLFAPTVESIVNALQQLCTQPETKKMKYMFLVGGLNCSQYLQKGIKERFGKNMKILIPENPESAILRGAVMFGRNPDHIRARVTQRTYGVGIYAWFNPSIHPQSRKVVIEGQERCKDVFDTLTKAGERVAVGREIELTYYPVRSDATSVDIILYESEQGVVSYTDEPGVSTTGGHLLVSMPDTTGGQNRPIDFRVKFGRTEIEARARDRSRNGAHWVHTVVRFATQ